MSPDLVQSAVNLGVAGFAILVMWWMYQSAERERQRNDLRLDKRDEKYEKLQEEVRGEIMATLVAATTTNTEAIQVLKLVLDRLNQK